MAGKAGARGVVKPTAVKKSVTKPVKKSVKKSEPTAVKKTPAKKAPAKTVRKPATAKPARPVAKTAAKGVTGSKDKKLQAYLVEQKRSLKRKKAEAQDRENRQIVAARKARVETIARNKENARLAKQRCSRATSLSSPRPLGQPHNALPPPQRIAPSSRISAARVLPFFRPQVQGEPRVPEGEGEEGQARGCEPAPDLQEGAGAARTFGQILLNELPRRSLGASAVALALRRALGYLGLAVAQSRLSADAARSVR